MKSDRWLTRPRATDLDLSPTDATHTKSEHFRDGLLRGPPPGEMQDVRAAIHLLPLRIHAIEKAARVPLQHVSNPHRLDDVDSHLRAHERNPQSVAWRVAPVSGVCASRGCPGDPPRGMSAANDAQGGEGAASARPRTGDRTRQRPDRTR